MDALPLPPRPNLDQYRKRAKELAVAARTGDARAVRAWASDWLTALTQAQTHIEAAFVYACRFECVDVAIRLLDLGVDVAAADGQKMTALHHAAAHGLIDLARALVARGAPLEVENVWGGTVLDSTAYFAEFAPIKGVDYLPVLEMLVAAGADVRVLDEYPADGKVVPEFWARLGRREG